MTDCFFYCILLTTGQGENLSYNMSKKIIDDAFEKYSKAIMNNFSLIMKSLDKKIKEKIFAFTEEILQPFKANFKAKVKPTRCEEYMYVDRDLFKPPYVVIDPGQETYPGFRHLCDFHTDHGGWIVILRRATGNTNFDRSWDDYKNGFGPFEDDFWLGNEKIHRVTSRWPHELLVKIPFQGTSATVHYYRLDISDEKDGYRLKLGPIKGTGTDFLRSVNGQKFSTKDRDNDNSAQENCAKKDKGGWWLADCNSDTKNLNGNWEVDNNNHVNLREMMIRRKT